MKIAIPTISNDDLDIANSAMIGAETVVSVSYTDVALVGTIKQGANLAGSSFVAEGAYAPPAGTAGLDLQLVCDNGVLSDEEIIIKFNVTQAGVGTPPTTATGHFIIPAYAKNDTFNLPIGLAVDVAADDHTFADGATTSASPNLTSATAVFVAADVGKPITGTNIPAGTTVLSRTNATTIVMSANATGTGSGLAVTISGAATKIRTITGINAITGGRAGNRFTLVSVPDDFVEVMCAMNKNPTLPSQKAIAIPCGYNGARWVKKGRSDAPTLEISAKYTSYADGLLRLNGHRASVMLEAIKDDRLLTERSIFGGWRPTVTPRHGDGDSEDEVTATGIYESLAVAV